MTRLFLQCYDDYDDEMRGVGKCSPSVRALAIKPVYLLNIYFAQVAETCQLAVKRLEWLNGPEAEGRLSQNPYRSVDPAPATLDLGVGELKEVLLDEARPLFERYRAMFSLRNTATPRSVLALAEGIHRQYNNHVHC